MSTGLILNAVCTHEKTPGSEVDFQPTEDGGKITAKYVQYDYLVKSNPIRLGFGEYRLDYDIVVAEGGVTVGAMDQTMSKWLLVNNHLESDHACLNLGWSIFGRTVVLVIAGFNSSGRAATRCELTNTRLTKSINPFGSGAPKMNAVLARMRRWWRMRLVPRMFRAQIDLMCAYGRLHRMVGWCMRRSRRDVYLPVINRPGGYATRAIVGLRKNGRLSSILTADTGDDTLSLFPVANGALLPRKKMVLPPRSAPIGLAPLNSDDWGDGVAVCLFNFDVALTVRNESSVTILKDFDFKSDAAISDQQLTLLKRSGCCGFRGVVAHHWQDGSALLAAADRDDNCVHIVRWPSIDLLNSGGSECLRLGDGIEPVGIAANAAQEDPQRVLLYMTCRISPHVVVVSAEKKPGASVVQRFPVGGLSRSSLALGNFRGRGLRDVAMALWGGDPRNINASGSGDLVVCHLDPSGLIQDSERIPAGTNPTDVVAGDFDGDGIDEIAVLNYGSGLGPADRQDTGGIQVFKYINNRIRCVATIRVPNPRIGAAIDIDGDGVPELLASLFFERRIIVIKCLNS